MIKYLKLFFTALFEMYTFKKATTMPRILEIGFGVLGYCLLGIIIYGLTK